MAKLTFEFDTNDPKDAKVLEILNGALIGLNVPTAPPKPTESYATQAEIDDPIADALTQLDPSDLDSTGMPYCSAINTRTRTKDEQGVFKVKTVKTGKEKWEVTVAQIKTAIRKQYPEPAGGGGVPPEAGVGSNVPPPPPQSDITDIGALIEKAQAAGKDNTHIAAAINAIRPGGDINTLIAEPALIPSVAAELGL